MTSNIDSLPCCCEELHKMMTCSTSGLQHLAVNLEDQRPLAKLKLVQNVNANSTYFAVKSPYFEWTIGAFRRWLKHHGLRAELAEDFSQVLSNGNNLLINSNRPSDCLFIVFNIFFAFSLGIRCFTTVIMNNFTSPFFFPMLYFQDVLNTWSDIDLFERLHYTGQQAQVAITSTFPPYLLKRYPWGFRKQAALPVSFF